MKNVITNIIILLFISYSSLHHRVRTGSVAYRTSHQWVSGVISLGVIWPGCEANHYLHLVPRSRVRGARPPLLQYAFVVWCSAKSTGQLYLLRLLSEVHRRLSCFTVIFRRMVVYFKIGWDSSALLNTSLVQ